ncbi:hypothetical protein [Filimonas effusa]|uniref:Peptidase S74 domain-containing protein n=1 Tax=Filimonas effusa TaxID=2508721 RepID=A0A4Q1D9A4_9BACT|nr:hypothetical protein [Filimonas effusa]RXK85911.1 hypothetical protein ESB13_03620 [Filimonas effusa]
MRKHLLISSLSLFFFGHCFCQNVFPDTGNVGVGTLAPENLLEVHGPVLITNGAVRFQAPDTSKGIQLELSTVSNYVVINGGSLAPKTDMGQDLSTGQWRFRDAWFGTGINLNASAFINGSDYNGIILGKDSNSVMGLIKYPDRTAGIWRSQGQAFSIGTTNSDLFSASVFQTHFYTSGDGNVGINTVSPSEKLSVNGNIITKRIKVNLQAADWADHVFERSYRLLPVSDLKQYIKDNGHLADVPSAKETEHAALNIGNNLSVLLRKIEELTLYLIQQQQALEQLKQDADMEQQLLLEKIRKMRSLVNRISA